jgi:hypothetical protein
VISCNSPASGNSTEEVRIERKGNAINAKQLYIYSKLFIHVNIHITTSILISSAIHGRANVASQFCVLFAERGKFILSIIRINCFLSAFITN